MSGTAIEKYQARAQTSLLCIGLDSQYERLPQRFKGLDHPQFAFNRWIIEQTAAFACAYKPNMAFYEARGEKGWHDLALTLAYLQEQHPHIMSICDAKRADIGNTNHGYVRAIFDELNFDAITLNPYLGREALAPFLERQEKACIILCRTSNKGAGEFQNLLIDGKPLWQHLAEAVRDTWNGHQNCMLVAGATATQELGQIRAIVGEMPLLIPGIGAQGGDLEQTLAAGLTPKGGGVLLNSSRGIIFAQNPQEAAQSLHEAIENYRNLHAT